MKASVEQHPLRSLKFVALVSLLAHFTAFVALFGRRAWR
jgi:hypothetical protein